MALYPFPGPGAPDGTDHKGLSYDLGAFGGRDDAPLSAGLKLSLASPLMLVQESQHTAACSLNRKYTARMSCPWCKANAANYYYYCYYYYFSYYYYYYYYY